MTIHLNGTRTLTILPATKTQLALEEKGKSLTSLGDSYIHSVFNYFYSFFLVVAIAIGPKIGLDWVPPSEKSCS